MLKEEKTEFIVFGQPNNSTKLLLNSSPSAPYLKTLVRDLGFRIEDNLKMVKKIHSAVRTCTF